MILKGENIMNIREALQEIEGDEFLKTFRKLYGTDEQTLEYQKRRYLDAVNKSNYTLKEIT